MQMYKYIPLALAYFFREKLRGSFLSSIHINLSMATRKKIMDFILHTRIRYQYFNVFLKLLLFSTSEIWKSITQL